MGLSTRHDFYEQFDGWNDINWWHIIIVAVGGFTAVSTGGLSATGGSISVTATGGLLSRGETAPGTYTVDYDNGSVSSSTCLAPSTCPAGQTVSNCVCAVLGIGTTMPGCAPSGCESSTSSKYPQAYFDGHVHSFYAN